MNALTAAKKLYFQLTPNPADYTAKEQASVIRSLALILMDEAAKRQSVA